MFLKDVPINDVKPNPRNPRKNDDAVPKLIERIKSVGYRTPIIVDENMMILAGHTRWKALKQMGWETIPVILQWEDMKPEEKGEYSIGDNKVGEFSDWGFDFLLEDYAREELADWGFVEFAKETMQFDEIKTHDLIKNAKTHFEITFNFPNDYREIVSKLIKEQGKEYVSKIVLEAIVKSA